MFKYEHEEEISWQLLFKFIPKIPRNSNNKLIDVRDGRQPELNECSIR